MKLAAGETVAKALTIQVPDKDGAMGPYKKSDFKYDVKSGSLPCSDFVRREVLYPDYGLVVSHGGLCNLNLQTAVCFYQGGDCSARYTVY